MLSAYNLEAQKSIFYSIFLYYYFSYVTSNSCATFWLYCELKRKSLYSPLGVFFRECRQWQYIIKSIFIGNSTRTTHLSYQNTHACAVSKQVFPQLQLNTENHFQHEGMLVHIKVKLKHQRAFHWQPPPRPSIGYLLLILWNLRLSWVVCMGNIIKTFFNQ